MVTLLLHAIAAGCGQRSFSRRVGMDIAWSSIAAAEEPAMLAPKPPPSAIANEPRSQTRKSGNEVRKGPIILGIIPDSRSSLSFSKVFQHYRRIPNVAAAKQDYSPVTHMHVCVCVCSPSACFHHSHSIKVSTSPVKSQWRYMYVNSRLSRGTDSYTACTHEIPINCVTQRNIYRATHSACIPCPEQSIGGTHIVIKSKKFALYYMHFCWRHGNIIIRQSIPSP